MDDSKEVLAFRAEALVVKNPPAKAGDVRDADSIPGWGRSPGGAWQPTPVSYLKNPLDRGAWWAVVQGVAKSSSHQSDLTQHSMSEFAHGISMATLLPT